MQKLFFISLISIFYFIPHLERASDAAIQTKTVHYSEGSTELEGFIAYDDSTQAKRPVVLIVHEWKGLGDYEKRRAKEIAKLGYLAFAIDIYGKGIRVKTDEEAGKLAGTYKKDRALLRKRAQAGLQFIEKNSLSSGKIAAIGFCFGGTTALEMARAGFDLKGIVSFHGGLDASEKAKAGDIKAKVLVLHGANDPYISKADFDAFQDEMKNSKADWQIVQYGGAVHGFSKKEAGDNTASGYAYNAEADRKSFKAMTEFLKDIFRK